MNTQIEIDLGLARVSEGVLAMLENANGIVGLSPRLLCELLDALADEHMRRLGMRGGAAAMLKVPTKTLDADELWHSQRMLGIWLSNTDQQIRSDPDLEAMREVIARMWMGVRGVLSEVTEGIHLSEGTTDETPREAATKFRTSC